MPDSLKPRRRIEGGVMSEWRIFSPFPLNPPEEFADRGGSWHPVFPDPYGKMNEAGFALSGNEEEIEYEAA